MTNRKGTLQRMLGRALGTATRFRERLSDEKGQALLEYALILTFVALACVAALTFKLPGFINGVFDQVGSKFP